MYLESPCLYPVGYFRLTLLIQLQIPSVYIHKSFQTEVVQEKNQRNTCLVWRLILTSPAERQGPEDNCIFENSLYYIASSRPDQSKWHSENLSKINFFLSCHKSFFQILIYNVFEYDIEKNWLSTHRITFETYSPSERYTVETLYRELETWLCSYGYFLLLQGTGDQFPAPMSHNPPNVTSTPNSSSWGSKPSSGLFSHLYTQRIFTQMHKHTQNKLSFKKRGILYNILYLNFNSLPKF